MVGAFNSWGQETYVEQPAGLEPRAGYADVNTDTDTAGGVKKKRKNKEVIFLKDSNHGLAAGLGAGPNTRSLESLLWVLVATAAQTPTARPRGGSDCRCTKLHEGSGWVSFVRLIPA